MQLLRPQGFWISQKTQITPPYCTLKQLVPELHFISNILMLCSVYCFFSHFDDYNIIKCSKMHSYVCHIILSLLIFSIKMTYPQKPGKNLLNLTRWLLDFATWQLDSKCMTIRNKIPKRLLEKQKILIKTS
jgi:hypothetical protein